jgi:hypothetical protein
VNTDDGTGVALGTLFDFDIEGTGVDEVESPSVAVGLCGFGITQC